MDDILTQDEIDELIEALNVGALNDWRVKYAEKIRQQTEGSRFKPTDIFVVEDYDLFYSKYPLETLTGNTSILRRYAYGDTASFKAFRFFKVVEDYKRPKINIVSVIGIPDDIILDSDAIDSITQGDVNIYLVDASSLMFAIYSAFGTK